MLSKKIISGIFAFLCVVSFTGFVSAASSDTAYTQVAVTNVDLDPDVFVKGDTGTITVTVKNTGTEAVSINRAELYSKDITVENDDAYDTVTPIGSGNEMQFSFSVVADASDGIYYPRFYLDYTGSNSYSYNIPVKIDSSELSVSVIDSPGSWQQGNEDRITILVGNPRENAVTGVEITPSGDGISSSQTSYFIGTLESDGSKEVNFDITPDNAKSVDFVVTWRNGINIHTSEISVPLVYGEDKTGADPVLNNVKTTSSGSYYTLSGDITNAGLEDAMSIKVTAGDPAVPVDPYEVYVIGSLEPDDFSSFEVTYEMPSARTSGEIPVIITYKDSKGNDYEKEYSVSSGSGQVSSADSSSTSKFSGGDRAPQGGGMMGGMGGGFSQIPIIEIFVVIIAGLGLVVAWKKGYIKKGSEAVKARISERKK